VSRFTNAANEAAFSAEHVLWVVLADLDFASGAVRAHMGAGDIVLNGLTYSGLGEFASLSEISERPDARDFSAVSVGLKGIDPALLSKVPTRSEYVGRFATITLVAFNPETYQPITPLEAALFEGFMDVMTFERQESTASITLTLKHFDSLYAQTIGLWNTSEHQKGEYSGDTIFDLIPTLQDKEIRWGNEKVSGGGSYTGGDALSGFENGFG
jgi:hypothetical protein